MTDLTIERLASLAGESIFDRGQQYFRSGRVLSVTAENGSVRGRVKGSDQYPYRVEIDLRSQRPGVRCTCPFNMGPWCKHAVAVAMSYCLDESKQTAVQARPNGRPSRNGRGESAPSRNGDRSAEAAVPADIAPSTESAADGRPEAEGAERGQKRRRRRPRRRRRGAPGEDAPVAERQALAAPPDQAIPAQAPMSLGRLQEGADAVQDPMPLPTSNTGALSEIDLMREEIRRMVLEELRGALRS